MNDLSEVISNMLYMFADDTKLFHLIQTPCDHLLLQQDLDSLVNWCEKWQMSFNTTKCHVMSIGNSSMLCDYTMNLGNHMIPIIRVQEECDLGVLFSSNLKFDKHISNTV